MSKLSSKKFLSLTPKRKHKHAAFLLREIIDQKLTSIDLYRDYEEILALPPVENTYKKLMDRLFLHEDQAEIPYSKQYSITTKDKVSTTPLLEVDIYLENLRSMHNIGAILRTAEAFRLGTIYLSKELPPSAMEKILKTSMGAEKFIPVKYVKDIQSLRKPIIAVETAENARDCNTFPFPSSFTLLFGNEKYGLSDSALQGADHLIHIPLVGAKNSLNVASAFAIIASCIRNRYSNAV